MRSRLPFFLLGLIAPMVAGLAAPGIVQAEKSLGRLASDVVPVFQAVELTLDPREPGYRGKVSIDLRVATSVDNFRLHAEGLSIDVIRLSGDEGEIAVESEAERDDLLRLQTAHPLPPGDYQLRMEFSAPFDTTAVSLYRLDYEGKAYAYTQFQSDDAREAFPCFDEPAFKIPFQMTLRTPVGDGVVTNTPIETERIEDGWKVSTFARTKPLPTYLLMLAVGPFDFVDVPDFPVPARIVTPHGKAGLAGTARDEIAPILAALERYFGRPYPYRKLDLIGVPEFWPGAMEHPGGITYRDVFLLLDPETLTPAQRQTLVRFSAHEFAHQWFGNLVTMEWWDDLWLNEAFADWMGDRIADEVHPEMHFRERQLTRTQRVFRGDARASAEGIRRPVESSASLTATIAVTYAKGKLVLNMFENWIGEEAFRDGVLSYVNENEWGNATADDLWRALDASSGRTVSAALAGFLEQPGYPIVSVERVGSHELRLTQERFRSEGVETPDLSWDTPLVLRYFDGSRVRTHSVLLGDGEATVSLPSDGPIEWVYPNADAGGYFRWSMPREELTALAQVAAGSLTPRERIELLGNIGALMDAGQLAADVYLEMLLGFAEDDSPTVLASVLAGLARVHQILPDEPSADAFQVYVRSLLSPALDRFGMDPVSGEEETVTGFRPQLLTTLGDWGNDPVIQEQARRNTETYLSDSSSLPASVVGAWLSLAAQTGDADLWDEFEARFTGSAVPREQNRYLGLLGGFRDPALRERALAYALNGQLQPQQVMTIPRVQTALGDEHADHVADWVMDHYEHIVAAIPPPSRQFLVWRGSGCSQARWDRAREFFSREENQVEGTRVQLVRAEDSVTDCIRQREREAGALRGFLLAFAARGDDVEAARF